MRRHRAGCARVTWGYPLTRGADPAAGAPRPDAPRPVVVAHRGCAARHPENTIPALRAALDAGVRHLEVDVLMSADGVPVLMHDATLARTAGRPDEVASLTWAELATIEVAERARLGDAGAGVTVPSLGQLVELLREHPEATAFVELKRAALERFGRARVVERVLAELAPVAERTIVISFDRDAVALARARGARRIGWVLERYDDASLGLARDLAPEFLFCNHEKIAPGPGHPWRGPWAWVVYEITDAALARALAARGVAYVESMAPDALLTALAAA